ncbi:hypothetical protein [Rathayibacter tanaceti]|uniref:Cell filamentation protein Fic n=2 Tax=Rathayibacter tanaceti TaxID=1671680 RepID=A0A166HZB4_9MICO|nr:hypothetical protein [Rathayibacter tanaceti]KZX21385.1 cell filamentation protein Fic [Rathayibacter tanaceti]QHC54948.1 hypothetical protein GSU10_04340 [Rathayibacter tanaceti]TCO38490.1 hypothetical protein EV639_102133 [Rathayibacter tanaceti]
MTVIRVPMTRTPSSIGIGTRRVPPFAGEVLDVDLQAGGRGIASCRPEFISGQIEFEFRRLEGDGYLRGRDVHGVAEGLADHWGEITAVRPFRDGNTRSQSAFVTLLSGSAGWSIQRPDVDPSYGSPTSLSSTARPCLPPGGPPA